MSKDDLKIKPVEQDVTAADLKKVSGGDYGCYSLVCDPEDGCPEEGGDSLT